MTREGFGGLCFLGGAWFVVLFLFVVGVCLLWLVGFSCLGFFQF